MKHYLLIALLAVIPAGVFAQGGVGGSTASSCYVFAPGIGSLAGVCAPLGITDASTAAQVNDALAYILPADVRAKYAVYAASADSVARINTDLDSLLTYLSLTDTAGRYQPDARLRVERIKSLLVLK